MTRDQSFVRNPVFESSMTRQIRSFRAPLLLTLYGFFLLLVSIGALKMMQSDMLSLTNLRVGMETYVYLSVMQFALIVLVCPALTAGSIAGERERQTLDLLLCTRVGAPRIVLGKLFSSVCFLALMIVSSMPIMAVLLFFGGITLGNIMMMLLFLIVTAFACCSIGIFCSALFKRTITATVVAYLAVFAIGIGTILFPLLFQYGQLTDLQNVVYSSSSTSTVSQATSAFAQMPKILLFNPGIGLFSMLVDQTGMLQRTLESFLGYRGGQFHSLLKVLGSVSSYTMATMTACSVLLVGLAVLFVKPTGRKVRRK